MSELIVTLILAIHLVVMNLASAGPLAFLWMKRLNRGPGEGQSEVERLYLRIVRWSVAAFLVGMVTGVLLWLILPGDGLSEALDRFPARAFSFAGAELLFSLLCLLPLAFDWNFLHSRMWLGKLLALSSSTNLLYHFPPLMAIIGQLAVNPHWTSELVLHRSALLGLMSKGYVLALSCHFGLASLAVAAITTFLLAKPTRDAELLLPIRTSIRKAAMVALIATLWQIPVGIWLLVSMSAATRTALMGGSLVGSIAFVAALTATIMLLQRLLSIVLGDCERRTIRATCWLMLVVIALMTGTLRWSRPALQNAVVLHENISRLALATGSVSNTE